MVLAETLNGLDEFCAGKTRFLKGSPLILQVTRSLAHFLPILSFSFFFSSFLLFGYCFPMRAYGLCLRTCSIWTRT